MKCEHCDGAMIDRLGSWGEPDRIVCMACGREPLGEEKIMEEKEKMCKKCGLVKPITEFNKNSVRPDGHESQCRVCTTQHQRDWVAKKKKGTDGNSRKKRKTQKPGPTTRVPPPMNPANPIPYRIDDAILLDQQILKAIKKSVANQIIRIIEEAFA